MPIEVLLPDGSTRSFPNGTPEDEIRSQLMPASPTEKLRQDSGIPNPPGLGEDTLNRFLKGGAEGVAKAVQGTVRGLGSLLDLPNPKATPYYQWAERLSEGAKEAFPTDPARDPRFLSTLVESAGQMVPTIAASLVTPAAAVAQYGMAQGEQMAQEAEAAGRPDRANRALLLGALTGAATEGLLGVAPKFGAKLFGREAAGSLPRAFAEGSVKEGTQEGLEQLAQNQIAARETLAGYDPERPATAGVLESMAAGALLGGPVNAAAAALGPKVDHATVQATIDQAEARLENEEDQNTRLALEATVARGKELLKLPGLRVRRNRKPGFEDIAQQEGMSAVVDFVTDPGRQVQEDGKTVAVSEADTDLSTGRVKIYLPEVRSTSHLRGLLREEKTHLWLNTVPEGQTAFQTYLEQHPISPETVAALQEQGYLQGELTDQEYRSRLTDEFLAKLAKDDWWTRTTGELVAIVKNGLGLKLSSEQAGRLLLRNARKWTATSLGTNPARQGTQTEALTPPESVSIEGGVVAPPSLRESLRVTGTPEFKRWFGESTLRDETGNPLKVYHGTLRGGSDGIRVFRSWDSTDYHFPKPHEPGTHFGSLSQTSEFTSDGPETSGVVYPVYLRIENPLRTPDIWPIRGGPFPAEKKHTLIDSEMKSVSKNVRDTLHQAVDGSADMQEVVATLKRLGYDGIVYKNTEEGIRDTQGQIQSEDSYVPFDSNQIKSATGNRGTFNPQSSDIRESLRAVKPDEELVKLSEQYPGVKFSQDDRPSGHSAQYDPEQKTVSLRPDFFRKWQWERDNEVRTALMEAGVNQINPKALSDDIFGRLKQADPERVTRTIRSLTGSDVNDPPEDIRQQVAARILLEQINDQRIGTAGKILGTTSQIAFKLSGLARLATRMGLAWSGHSGSRGMLAAKNLLDNMVERAQLPPIRIEPNNPAQAFVDLHPHVTEVLSPGIRDLRTRASELDSRSYARRLWLDLSRRVDALTQEALITARAHPERLAAIPAEAVSFEPMAETLYEGTLEAVLGRQLTADETRQLDAYREERRARGVVHALNERDKLEIQLTQLGIDQPDRIDVARQRIQDEIAELTKAIQMAMPQHRMRADEIRASDAMVPYARAAQAVLDQDPDIREWASQYDQAEDSGLSPRPEGDITEALSLARQALRDRANVQAHTRAEQAERELGEFLTREYGPELRSIQGRIVERTRDLLESQTAMSDLVLALAGEADLSGTLSGRDAATALRNLNSAVSRLAIRMAQARADTLVGQMREQLRVGVPGESAYWINLNVAQVAQEVGLGEQATRQILQLLSKSPEFHNALFELHKNARGEAHQAVITAIERIEQALRQAELRESVDEETEAEKYRALAKSIAETRIDELSDITRGLKRDITSVERELAELEQRRLEKQYAADFFRTAADAFGELPNMRRMVFNTTDGGRRFEGFANVKPIVLRPGSAVSNETLKSLTQWCAAGTQALADGSADPQTLRGLAVGIPEAEKFISERFTDEQISKTLAPSYAVEWLSRRSWFRTKGLLPRLVPGLWGANVQQHQLAWNELHAKVEKLKIDEASRWDRLQRAAAKSLGLDLARRPGDAAQLYAAYNETANRLRRHNSGVEEGMLLWSTGGVVTPELLTWLQYDSKTLRKGTKLEAARPFGGVRENFPGRQVVRPGAPTGDIGLPRRANPSIVDEMRKVYVSAPRDAGRYTDRSSIDQWWARHSVAIGSHIQDPVREDVVVNRKPAMVQAELALSRAIDAGRVSLTDLRTIDDWADAIQAYIPATEQLDARTELRNELDQYGAHAISRFGGMDSSSPSKTALTISGEDDTTAFTQPASKMYYPPAFYQYGTSTGLSSALDQIADPAQKEYLESLIQAKEHLSARAGEIKRAIASGDYGNNAGLIRWVLEGQLGKTFAKGRDAITPDMAQTAADALDARAAVLATELTHMSEPQRGSLLTRLLNQIYPFLLLRPTVLASNVFGGPIAAQPVLASFFGPVKGSLLSFGAFPFSAGSMLWSQATDLIRWTAKLAHINLPPPQIDQYLEAYGIGASINHELTGEGERAAAGRLGLSGPAKALALTRGAANEASKIIGVRAGDKYLNRAMSQSVIPAVMWRLKSVAAGWKARAQQAVAEGRVTNLIDVTFDETDSGQAPQIREFLTSFGKPEELLAQIAGADFPWAKWWTNELAGRMGYALLQDVNVATPTNRPARNTLLGLVGWTAKMIDSVTALTRVTPETSTAERLRRATAYAILGALAASTAYYFQILGRQTVNGGIVAGATIIARLLQGLPVDPDDPTWAEKALNVLAAMNGWLRHHSPMLASAEDLATRAVRAVAAVSPPSQKALPYQPGFWERPWRDIALDLATAAPAGIGINQVQLPVLGIAEQTAASTLQIGRGAVTFAESPDDAGRAAALADLKAGTRNIANLFGLVGGAAMAFLVPGSETGRDTRSLVAGAANAAGVRMEAPFQSGSFLSRTPIRKELMAAGTDLATAQEKGDNAGIEAAQKKIDDLTQYVADRAARRATELGQAPAEAKKAGESAVKKLMGQLDPIRYGIGRSVTPEELSKLEARIGQNPAIQRDRAASKAIVARVASRRRFRPTRSMLSPLRKSRLPRVKLGRSQSRKIRL